MEIVSLEIATLLKKKNFNSLCEYCYLGDELDTVAQCNSELEKDEFSAPSFFFVLKWLRGTHKLDIVIYPVWVNGKKYMHKLFIDKGNECETISNNARSEIYEEALEHAIKEALKLI